MTDGTKDEPGGSPAYRRALAAVEAFGKMSPEDQRQFEADLIAMARAEGWLSRAGGSR